MDAVYLKIRKIARRIVAGYPRPDFYSAHPSEFRVSKQFYQSDTSIVRLRKNMAECLDDDYGHGMGHVEKVAIDAGTLVIIESRLAGQTENRVQRNLLLAQCAGLLHDIGGRALDRGVAGDSFGGGSEVVVGASNVRQCYTKIIVTTQAILH